MATRNPRSKPRSKRGGLFQLISADLLIAVGCGVLIAGFYAPPVGEIHPSVLVAFGEVLTFAGAILGIDYKYKYHSNGNKT